MKNVIFYIIVILTILSCGKKDKTSDKERQEQLQKEQKERIIEQLADKYDVSFSWDTLYLTYSIEFYEKLKNSYQIIDNVDIDDIYIKDSTYYISVNTGIWPSYYFDLSISETEYKKILNTGNSEILPDGIMVVNITDIRKFRLRIESYPEDEYTFDLEFDSSSDFIGSGKVVEIVIIE